MAFNQTAPPQLDQLYRQLVPSGPLPPPEKRWEVVLSSSNPQISETGMAMAQEYFARGQLLTTFTKFAQSTNETLAANALRSLTNFADRQTVVDEFKKGSLNSLVKLLTNAKFRLVALKFLVNFMRTEQAVELFTKAGGVTNLFRLLSEVKGEDLNIALLALNNLIRLTKPDKYSTFATTQNYHSFYTLFSTSRDDTDSLQVVLRILCTLTSEEQNRKLFLESKCVQYVVNNLLKSNAIQRGTPVKADALTLLANVLKDGRIADEVIKLQGLKLIFESLSDSNEEVKTAALAAVANFAYNVDSVHKTQGLILQSSLFKQLIELLKQPTASNQVQLRTVWAISNLMVHEDVQEAFKNVGGIKAIVAIANANVSEEVKLKALSAIFHMSMYYDSMRRSIVQNGGLKLLTSILRTSAGINLRQEACRTMINLSLTDENEGDFVVEKSIPPLIDILNRESHSEIVHLALMTLENLSFNPTLSEHIRECGGVKATIKLFSSTKDPKTQEKTARLIGKLALNSKSREEFQKNNGLNALRSAIATTRDAAVKDSIQLALNNMSVPVVIQEAAGDASHVDDDFKEYAQYIEDDELENNTFAGYKLEEYRDEGTLTPKDTKKISQISMGNNAKESKILSRSPTTSSSSTSPPPLPSTPPPPLPSVIPSHPRIVRPQAKHSTQQPSNDSALQTKPNDTNFSLDINNTSRPIRPPLNRHSSQPTLFVQNTENALSTNVSPRSKDDLDIKAEQEDVEQEEDYGLKRDQYLLDDTDTKSEKSKRKTSRWKHFSMFFSKMFHRLTYRRGNSAPLRSKNDVDDSQVSNPCITVLYDYHEYWCEGCKSGGVCIKNVNELRLVRAMLIREQARKTFRPLRPHTVNITPSHSAPLLQRVPSSEIDTHSLPNTVSATKTRPTPPPKPEKFRSKPLPTPPAPKITSPSSSPKMSVKSSPILQRSGTPPPSPIKKSNPVQNGPSLPPPSSSSSTTMTVPPKSPPVPKKLPDNMDPKKLEKAKRHFKRTKIAQELLVTEGTYVKNLAITIKKFQNPLLNAARSPKPFISEQDVRTIFSCIEIIYSYNTMLLEGLNARMQKWTSKQKIADVFIMMGDFLKMYTAYINNYGTAWRTMRKCRAESPRLAKFLEKTSMEDPVCAGLDLESYLIMPVQRTPRYQLLLQQLKDHTEPDHPDYNNICQALEKVIQINNYLNEKQREFEDRSKLIEAAFELVGTHAEEIVRPHRILIYSCKIELLLNNNSNNNTNTNNNNNNELIIPGKFYLFNDMIIVGKAVTYKGEIKYQILHLIILKKNHNLKQDKDNILQITTNGGEVVYCRCVPNDCEEIIKKHANLLKTQSNPKSTIVLNNI